MAAVETLLSVISQADTMVMVSKGWKDLLRAGFHAD